VYYQVCNPTNSKHGPASYQLHTECGWIDNLDPTTKDKFTSNTIIVDNTGLEATQLTLNTDLLPSDISITGVASQKCVSVGDPGEAEKPFVVRALYHSADITYSSTSPNTITSTTPISQPSITDLVDDSGNSRIACHMKLLSLQTLQPMTVVLDEKTISCVISVTTFSGGRASARPKPSVVGADVYETQTDAYIDDAPDTTPTASPDPDKNKPSVSTDIRIITASIFTVFVILLLILTILTCISNRRNKKVAGDLGKRASKSVKNAPKPPKPQGESSSSTLKKVAALAVL
jgi:hypothetical protein